jgi:crossover junction endodeoxyribonuclease RuvC
MIYFGIDPGKSGAIAAIWEDGQPYASQQKLNATESDIAEFLQMFDLDCAKAVIEKVSSSPQMGVVSAFSFGKSYGFLLGLLTAYRVPFVEVSPQRWQKAMHSMTKGDKNVTKRKAQQLWPKLKITHANADALLIAEYCRRANL